MKLNTSQLQSFEENGFLFMENLFSSPEAEIILQEMEKVIQEDCPRRILEKSGSVRSFFAPEQSSELFKNIVMSARLIVPSEQLLGSALYVHQSKLNTKYAMVGDWWDWHQDYTYWKKDDRMPEPKVLTAMIFLNEVNEFNGPLLLIPGSHKAGTVDEDQNRKEALASDPEWFGEYQQSTTYMSALTADLKYTIKQHTIAQWASRRGIYAAKGPAGSVLFFHGNVFHASSNNLSPWDRHTFLVTYNSVTNSLPEMDNPRPEFLASRNFSHITAKKSDLLTSHS